MKKGFSVKEIIDICKATLYCGDEDVWCENFTKDTREIAGGECYIGIKGAKFDGNSFYQDAFLKGAAAVILEESYVKNNIISKMDKPIIVVKDSILALKELATAKREASEAMFVGVTGSVGKTSTREMIANVLNEEYSTLKTENNYNNNIGLPLTILKLEPTHKAAVIEMGMNHLGEISYLSKIAKPNIAVITNIGTAHIGEVGSRENILKAKLEILDGMDNGRLVINNDNDLLHKYYLENSQNIVTIGIDNSSDFRATDIDLQDEYSKFNIVYQNQKYAVFCPVPGKVFVYNSLVAFAVGTLLKIEPKKIIEGIGKFTSTNSRLEKIKWHDVTLINDAYNASVDSMKSSLEILGKYSSRKIAVLGDMLELGTYSQKLHEEVGKYVVDNKIDILVTVGTEAEHIVNKALELGMKKENVIVCSTNEEATEQIKKLVQDDDIILFKASNGMKFKEIVSSLINE